MVKRSVLGGANAAQAFATCRREASSCHGKTATRLVIKARRLFPRTATRPVDQNHKLLPLLVRCMLVALSFFPLFLAVLPSPRRSLSFYLSLSPPLLLPQPFASFCHFFCFALSSVWRISLRVSRPRLPSSPGPQCVRSRPRSGNLRKSTGYQVLMHTLLNASIEIVPRLPLRDSFHAIQPAGFFRFVRGVSGSDASRRGGNIGAGDRPLSQYPEGRFVCFQGESGSEFILNHFIPILF